jgi:hypothetical protein
MYEFSHSLGHSRPSHSLPFLTKVGFDPKATKMLRCVRPLKGEKLLASRQFAFGTRSQSHNRVTGDALIYEPIETAASRFHLFTFAPISSYPRRE